MAIQTGIDGQNMMFPGVTDLYHLVGGQSFIDTSPTNNENTGYYTAMALSFLTPAGAESKVVRVEQYSLRAIESGFYPVMKSGFKAAQELVWLEKDEIWKFGTTKNPFTRYSQKYLDNVGEFGVRYFTEFEGTLQQSLQVEKMKILNYFERWGFLPAGNKIRK